ncbi:peptidoglycan-recognition protein LC-like isoform X1 [Epargyreus clarus]|uniref:peptidoglycan-recognition protein LC-like isoform X1 n=1 Tax=Epargyreus clarus TaxID=520877 RepID=UPI003C2E3210
MAMKVESLTDSPNLSLRVKGDLGDLQVSGDASDCDDDETCDKQKVSRTISTVASIPPSLVRASVVPVYGSVAVTNSENVQFGNNTYFNGPVTIKQIIQSKSGVENESYTRTDEEQGSTPGPFRGKTTEAPIEKHQFLVWHKVTLSAICVTVIGGLIAIILVLQNRTDHQSNSSPPDFSTNSDPSTNSTVVGYCYENYQVIIITIILLPLTLLLISCGLLTREVSGKAQTSDKRTFHENCLIKNCSICKKEDPLIIAPGHLRIVSRLDWVAQPVEHELNKLILPAPWVIITHTATGSCFTQSECVLHVRNIQTFHIESRGWDDIGYNFLVGGDGSVYYGRGWDYEGAHTKYYNKYSIGIAFIGTFNSEAPTKQQVEACQKLIKLGVELKKLAKDYKLLAHRQLMSTLSPGDRVYNIIKEWPHFVSNTTDISQLLPKDRRA